MVRGISYPPDVNRDIYIYTEGKVFCFFPQKREFLGGFVICELDLLGGGCSFQDFGDGQKFGDSLVGDAARVQAEEGRPNPSLVGGGWLECRSANKSLNSNSKPFQRRVKVKF